jgi:competence protein ComGC
MIIAALILLFVPKLAQQKDYAVQQSNQALVKVVNEQYEMYRIEQPNEAQAGKKLNAEQLEKLREQGYLTDAQIKKYNELPQEAFK